MSCIDLELDQFATVELRQVLLDGIGGSAKKMAWQGLAAAIHTTSGARRRGQKL